MYLIYSRDECYRDNFTGWVTEWCNAKATIDKMLRDEEWYFYVDGDKDFTIEIGTPEEKGGIVRITIHYTDCFDYSETDTWTLAPAKTI